MAVSADVEMMPTEVESGCCACERGSCTDGIDTITSKSQNIIIKIFGILTILFSIIEFGVGGTVYSFLTNYDLGAFWVSLIAFFAGFCALGSRNRGWVTGACVLASVSILIAFVGSVRDGIYSPGFLLLTACARGEKMATVAEYYGAASDHAAAGMCLMRSGPTFVSNGCYCVSSGGSYCGQYTLSSNAMSASMNCGNILTTYSNGLAASTAMCVLILILVFCTSIISCVILCCPIKALIMKKEADELETKDSNFGIVGTAQ